MIVATAGHIDHGKTSLVKALTGVDTDRLPEEKRRGMTIDLGFAYRRGPDDVVLGFVDVPGHERFVHTMVAGVGAVDCALLVVAADDGPMPQTREHLSILSLLGIRLGAIVVTKIDKSEPGRATEIAREMRAMATDDVWSRAPHFAVSAVSGEGIAALLSYLEAEAARTHSRRRTRAFRMAADRVFSIQGAGLVVSGAVTAGRIWRGDEVVVSPAGFPARVRLIHANNREADAAAAGDRCALNLVLQRTGAIRRGDWIMSADASKPTNRFDGQLRILETAPRTFRTGTRVHLHVGTADVLARVDVLGRGGLRPGETGSVQIVTEKPVEILCADRFVIRDQSATVTLGGGAVVDPWSAVRGRARPQRLAVLGAMAGPSPEEAFPNLLSVCDQGIDWDAFRRGWNLPDDLANEIAGREPTVELEAAGSRILLARDKWDLLSSEIIEALRDWHANRPEDIGPSQRDIAAWLGASPHSPLMNAAIEKLAGEGKIARSRTRLHLPGHEPVLAPADRKMWALVSALYDKQEMKPPTTHEIASLLKIDKNVMEPFLDRMARRGYIARVSANRYFPRDHLRRLASLAESLAREASDGAFVAATYRDRCNLGRNLTIELLEYFDRIGFTQLLDGKRVIRRDPAFLDA